MLADQFHKTLSLSVHLWAFFELPSISEGVIGGLPVIVPHTLQSLQPVHHTESDDFGLQSCSLNGIQNEAMH